MPATTPQLGHGTAITFSSGFIARMTSFDWGGITREMIPTTTFDTSGGEEFLPAETYDPGSINVEMQFKSDDTPPITSAKEAVTVTWGDAETASAQGALSDFAIRAEDKGVITASASIKLSGDITW